MSQLLRDCTLYGTIRCYVKKQDGPRKARTVSPLRRISLQAKRSTRERRKGLPELRGLPERRANLNRTNDHILEGPTAAFGRNADGKTNLQGCDQRETTTIART
ncbi:hypothetical protein QNI16_36150 [Cytophagaceae bacterium YF14B1]|uniref:Uncharacterized protein n=1 Tax=Xanthocytophaga flava TaxID=3048013 RepID=A0AAE3QV56_9BACT|nr:hypothetical protein [Xanthocytophaga flavus]MDJ1485970.1 hypothetical protein [Xanthocytophaga flavus]